MREGWTESRIDELGNGRRPVLKAGPFGSSVTKATYQPSGYKVYGQQEVVAKDLNAEAYYVSEDTFRRHKGCEVKPGDLLMTMMGTIGRVYRVQEGAPEGIINPRLVRIAFDVSRILPEFAEAALEQPPLQRLLDRRSHGGTMQGLNLDALASIRLQVPPLPEQRKIAAILRTWDQALDKLAALRAAKARKAAAIRLRFFESEYVSRNRLRRARDLFEPVSERARPDLPLLAVMQDIGIVRRDELDRRVAMPDGETSAYKVVRSGDFVISLRSFEGGLEYSRVLGLVSPAYTVLRPLEDLAGDYYRYFFKSSSFIGRLDKLIFGIRDGKQIAFRDFGDMLIPSPPIGDQTKHAVSLGSIEAELALIDRQIDAFTRQKRGLMQKLLSGEWPVIIDKD